MAFLEQVGGALRQGEVDIDLRIQLGVARHQRYQILGAQAGKRMHAQPPSGREVGATGLGGGLVDPVENLPTALQIALARLGQAQPASGAIEQPRAQAGLQLGHQPRHLGGGQPEHLGSGGEAAAVGDPGKHAHGLQDIHGKNHLRNMSGTDPPRGGPDAPA
ncbi:hypothetical protein D3C85_874830 [compost metagenome]